MLDATDVMQQPPVTASAGSTGSAGVVLRTQRCPQRSS
jgi:hypothetical protein